MRPLGISEEPINTPLFGHRMKQGDQIYAVTFFFYCLFLLDFFLHLSSRISGISVIRPTLLIVIVISILLLLQYNYLKKRNRGPLYSALFTLILYIILSLPFVEFPGSVIRENFTNFVKAIVFFYFTAEIVGSSKRLKVTLFIFVSCQIFRVLEPLYLNLTQGYWGSSTYLDGDFANRLSGAPHDVINPNELGFVIVTLIPFLHFLVLPQGVWGKLVYALLVPILLYALVLTMSRGAFLALLVIGWMIFKKSDKKFVLITIAFVCAIAGWGQMNNIQKDRYLSLVSDQTLNARSVDGRINGMLNEFRLGFNKPVFGHGLGTTPESKYHYFGKRQASHNMYAELLIEIGLIGMILFLRFIYFLYKQIRILPLYASISEQELRIMNVVLAIFWMYVVYSINYWGLSQSYWYWLAGLTVALTRIIHLKERATSVTSEKKE